MKPSATHCSHDRSSDKYEAHVGRARAAGRFPIDPRTVAETLIYMRHLPHCRPAAENLAAMGLPADIGRPVNPIGDGEKESIVEGLASDPQFAKAVAHVLRGVA